MSAAQQSTASNLQKAVQSPFQSARASELGFVPERLARIAPFYQQHYIDNGKLPCVQISIGRRGQLAYQCSLGKMGFEDTRPLASDAIFRIYSMTKPMTSVAFMMLVEEGKVALDDPVSKYIPEFASLGVYVSGKLGSFVTKPLDRPMLVLDVLRHTTGFTYGFQARTAVDAAYRELGLMEPKAKGDLKAFIQTLATVPLEFSPGTAWNYGVSTDVLGYLLQVIEGKPLEQVLQERLIAPLGMKDTGFSAPADQGHRIPSLYFMSPEGIKLAEDPRRSSYLDKRELISGGGGLVSTSADYFRFCHMLMNGGHLEGKRYISRKVIDMMMSNHLPGGKDLPDLSVSMFSESIFQGVGFGLGFSVVRDPNLTMIPGSAGEAAWGGIASTAFFLDRKEDLFAIFMTQLMPSSTYPVRRQLRTLIYSALA
jgi:CubicO group peptidase (beta-lactamase class C family)